MPQRVPQILMCGKELPHLLSMDYEIRGTHCLPVRWIQNGCGRVSLGLEWVRRAACTYGEGKEVAKRTKNEHQIQPVLSPGNNGQFCV